MYAQALEVSAGTSEDLSQTICRELFPALRTERGFRRPQPRRSRDREHPSVHLLGNGGGGGTPATSVLRRSPRQARRPRSSRIHAEDPGGRRASVAASSAPRA